ncbi:MAG: exodeoxyribonuclease III [Nitrospirota bacterium]
MKILSWNVNGIRACAQKGLLQWMADCDADVICLQETKAKPEQLDKALLHPPGYNAYWYSAERPGYSGVVTYSRIAPRQVVYGLRGGWQDDEGRVIRTDFDGLTLFNVYFPNGQRDAERLAYKLAFYDHFLGIAEELRRAGHRLVVSGDYNTAHKEIDLANPKENSERSGFLPVERAWLDRFVAHGYVDTFREFNQEPDQYTWWTYRFGARRRNIGWRIDYHFVSAELRPHLTAATIHPEVTGSDHCPVGIELEL